MALTVGLTGGIGSGKTTISRIFSVLGIPVYNSDLASKHILFHHLPVKQKVALLFGDDIISDGQVNAKLLAKYVFNDKDKLKALTQILHPIVAEDFKKWKRNFNEHLYIIKESALIFEYGLDKELDKIIAVIASLETRIARVANRDKVSREDVFLRDSKQVDDIIRISKSDFIISNNENDLIIPQVWKIHRHFVNDLNPVSNENS